MTATRKVARDRPDLEEAVEESDEIDVLDEVDDIENDADLSKDKYVRQSKSRTKIDTKKPAARKKKANRR